jgi:exosome complex RNA-binding protein Rrp42 (RNase PH superfamily)
VWAVRVDVHVLDHCGNLADACVLSALAGLLAFRRPDVTVGGATGVQVNEKQKLQDVQVSLSACSWTSARPHESLHAEPTSHNYEYPGCVS